MSKAEKVVGDAKVGKYTYDSYPDCAACCRLSDTKDRLEEEIGGGKESLEEAEREMDKADKIPDDEVYENWRRSARDTMNTLEEHQEDLENIPKCSLCCRVMCQEHMRVMECGACKASACDNHLRKCNTCGKLTCRICTYFGDAAKMPQKVVHYHNDGDGDIMCDECHSKRKRDPEETTPEVAPKRVRSE
jgi:hypothetical protein